MPTCSITCLAAQPDASWLVIHNVRTLDYSEAIMWACAAAFGGDSLAGEMAWLLRPSPARIEETLAAALGSEPTIIAKQTLGQWLTSLRAAADKLDAANCAARLVWTRAQQLRLPDPCQIPITNADGVAMYTTTPGAGAGDPPVRTAAVDATGWEYGPQWVRLVAIDELWEKGSRNLFSRVCSPVETVHYAPRP
eukprot:6594819-Prymnesium_polylepis.1